MNRLMLAVGSLLMSTIFVGCYTQIGYYEPPRPTRQDVSHRDDKGKQTKSESQTRVETESEADTDDEKGYYGRRKPGYSDYEPYYRPYYYDYYTPYPYYGGYYYSYPYYGYHYTPYYPYYGHYGYRHYDHHYPRPRTRIGDLHHGDQRSRSYRGATSPQPSRARPSRSSVNEESDNAPARRSSGSRIEKLRRSERRH